VAKRTYITLTPKKKGKKVAGVNFTATVPQKEKGGRKKKPRVSQHRDCVTPKKKKGGSGGTL